LQIASIQNAANEQKQQIMNQPGISTAQAQTQIGELDRQNGYRVNNMNIQNAVLNQDVATLQTGINNQLKLQFDPIQTELDIRQKWYEDNQGELSKAEQNQFQIQQDQAKAQLDAQKTDTENKLSLLKQATTDGVTIPPALVSQINDPKTSSADAYGLLAKAGISLQNPLDTQIKQGQLAAQTTDEAYKKAEMAKIYSDIGTNGNENSAAAASWAQNIKSGTAKLSDVPASMKNAVSAVLAQGGSSQSDILNTTSSSLKELQDMVDNNKGFTAAVGSKIGWQTGFNLPWIGNTTGYAGTPAANFNAKLNQVKNDVVLPNLTLLHGLGRVTDREFQALSSAVTALGPNLSEDQFKTELKTITDTINKKMSQPDTQVLTGPDGKQYNVPNDQADAFIKAGGHK
jgi:hypothetical protein